MLVEKYTKKKKCISRCAVELSYLPQFMLKDTSKVSNSMQRTPYVRTLWG
jgi:hypothetical protein